MLNQLRMIFHPYYMGKYEPIEDRLTYRNSTDVENMFITDLLNLTKWNYIQVEFS